MHTERNLYKTILIVLYLSASLTIVAMIQSPSLVNERAGALVLSEFDGHKPFQYRVLMPLIIKAIESSTPNSIKSGIEDIVKPKIEGGKQFYDNGKTRDKIDVISENAYFVFVLIGLNFIIMFLFLLTMRKLLMISGYFSTALCDFLPLGIIIVMPTFYEFPNYIYDFSHLLLFALGLYLMYRQQWTRYLVIFCLAMLNKETSIMLTIIFVFYYLSILARGVFAKLLLWQVLIFIFIKSALFIIFKNNPGGLAEWHLVWNLDHLSTFAHYFRFEPLWRGLLIPFRIKIPWPMGLNLMLLLPAAFFIAYGWKTKPLFFRKATIYFPLLFVLAITMGLINELRAYYDAFIIIYILSIMGVVELVNDIQTKMLRGK